MAGGDLILPSESGRGYPIYSLRVLNSPPGSLIFLFSEYPPNHSPFEKIKLTTVCSKNIVNLTVGSA